MLRELGGLTIREAMACPHGKYKMACPNLSARRADRERAAGTLKVCFVFFWFNLFH
jgi:hypothetical protein